MEYSIWHQKVTVWSTPYGNIYSQMELILKHSIRHQKCARWSTPYGHYLMPYGVLHTVTIYCLMEYSIWSLWSSHFHVFAGALCFFACRRNSQVSLARPRPLSRATDRKQETWHLQKLSMVPPQLDGIQFLMCRAQCIQSRMHPRLPKSGRQDF